MDFSNFQSRSTSKSGSVPAADSMQFPQKEAPTVVGAGPMGAFFTAVNMIQQAKQNSENVKNQFELLNREQRFQREMNENLYKTYRRSLEGAGLNVNSALGGFPNTGSPSVSPSYNDAPQFDINSLQTNMREDALATAKIQQMQAETELMKAQKENVGADTELKGSQNWSIRELTPSQVDNLQTSTAKMYREISVLDANEAEIQAQTRYINETVKSAEIENFINDSTKDIQVMRIANLFNNEYLDGRLKSAQITQAYKTIQVMNSTIKHLNAQARLFNAQAKTEEQISDKKLAHLNQLVRNLAITGDKEEFQLQLDKNFSEQQRNLILKNMEYEGNLLDMKSDILPISALFDGIKTLR